MNADGSGEPACEANRGKPDGSLLRTGALISVLVGALGSVGLVLRAGQGTPRLLLVLFIIWVLSPFVALGWATARSKYWSVPARRTLCCLSLLLTPASLAIYGGAVHVAPPGSANAFVYVAIPPLSWLVMTLAVLAAVAVSRRRSTRGTDAQH